jgi:hypothetical protein
MHAGPPKCPPNPVLPWGCSRTFPSAAVVALRRNNTKTKCQAVPDPEMRRGGNHTSPARAQKAMGRRLWPRLGRGLSWNQPRPPTASPRPTHEEVSIRGDPSGSNPKKAAAHPRHGWPVGVARGAGCVGSDRAWGVCAKAPKIGGLPPAAKHPRGGGVVCCSTTPATQSGQQPKKGGLAVAAVAAPKVVCA